LKSDGGGEMTTKTAAENEREGRLKGRLKGVQKRKRARRDFECEVVGLKMRLVEVKEQSDH
jgi:hypothetical protein